MTIVFLEKEYFVPKRISYLGWRYKKLNGSQKKIANDQMDGTNFDCNKCSKIILVSQAVCMIGGKKGEIPDICYEYGAVCVQCFKSYKNGKT